MPYYLHCNNNPNQFRQLRSLFYLGINVINAQHRKVLLQDLVDAHHKPKTHSEILLTQGKLFQNGLMLRQSPINASHLVLGLWPPHQQYLCVNFHNPMHPNGNGNLR